MTTDEYYELEEKVRRYEYLAEDLKNEGLWLKRFEKEDWRTPNFRVHLECGNFFEPGGEEKLYILSHWEDFGKLILDWLKKDRERIIKEMEEL